MWKHSFNRSTTTEEMGLTVVTQKLLLAHLDEFMNHKECIVLNEHPSGFHFFSMQDNSSHRRQRSALTLSEGDELWQRQEIRIIQLHFQVWIENVRDETAFF